MLQAAHSCTNETRSHLTPCLFPFVPCHVLSALAPSMQTRAGPVFMAECAIRPHCQKPVGTMDLDSVENLWGLVETETYALLVQRLPGYPMHGSIAALQQQQAHIEI